jgi:Bacterial Ig-like domain (group 1)
LSSILVLPACGSDSGTGSSSSSGTPAVILVASLNPRTDSVGGTLSDTVMALVHDQHGNGVPNVEVQWAFGTAGGVIPSTTSVTDSSGIASMPWTVAVPFPAVQTIGAQYTLVASVAGVSSTATYQVSITPGNAVRVVMPSTGSGNNQSGIVGVALADSLTVLAVDQQGNPVPNVDVDWNSNFYCTGANQANTICTGTGVVSTNAEGIARRSWVPQFVGTDSMNVFLAKNYKSTASKPDVLFTAVVRWRGAFSLTVRLN